MGKVIKMPIPHLIERRANIKQMKKLIDRYCPEHKKKSALKAIRKEQE